ncbi:MAG TPA: hypothetical protein PKD85_22485 [Saprospiraceae bacterium]|nr:hypothetical protein [Saprospiraceae bacterium]
MATTISGKAEISLSFNHGKTAVADTINYGGKLSRSYSNDYTSTDLTKVYFANRGSPTPIATTETLDLTSLVSPGYGEATNFSTVKILVIKNTHTSAITVGGGSNPFIANSFSLPAGGIYSVVFSQSVSGSTKNIATSGTNYKYEISILGA